MSTVEKVLVGITGLAVVGTIFTSKYSNSIIGTTFRGYEGLIGRAARGGR